MDDLNTVEILVRVTSKIGTRYLVFASLAFVLFYIVLRRPLWFRKIQKRMPTLSDYGRDVCYSIVSISIFGIIASVSIFVLADYNAIIFGPISDVGAVWFVASLVWMVLLHDAYFYWMHRLMHTRYLYRHVHLVHHRSTNPSPWTAYAFHPFEAVVEAGIIALIAFTLPVHLSAVILFSLFQILYNVYGHLGFELYPRGFHKTALGRFVNTSVAHNQHHGRFTGNYGLYFLFWDRAMGTLREDYDAAFETTTGRADTSPGRGQAPEQS